MKRRDLSFVFSLCIAMSMIFVLCFAGVIQARRDLGWFLPWPHDFRIAIREPITAPPQPIQDWDIGGAGLGKGINSSPGDRPLKSTVPDPDQEQAWMMHDAFGVHGSRSGSSMANALEGDDGNADPFSRPADSAQPFAPKSKTPLPIKVPKNSDPTDPAPTPPTPTPTPADNTTATNSQPTPKPAENTPAQKSGRPGSTAAAGSPAPKDNFESVPVTNEVSAVFDGTKLDIRNGRKSLTRNLPDISVAGWNDLYLMNDPHVELAITIDSTGNVTDVRFKHTTGSDSVDLPCQRAAATWWFEPRKDENGKPLASEVITFTISFK